MTRVYLALGSNLGDRRANLAAALHDLATNGVTVTARSSTWETPPVPTDQPRYLNAVVAAETSLSARELLSLAKAIEARMGRRPSRRWGPRPCDIDILFSGDDRIDEPDLQVPHPRIAERAFVLAPLSEVTAGPLPVLGVTALDLLSALPPEPMWRVAG